MKIATSEICSYCNDIDTLEHYFYFCPKVQTLWETVKIDIQCILGFNVILTSTDAILGMPEQHIFLDKETFKMCNYLIILAKLCITQFKHGQTKNLGILYEMEKHFRKEYFVASPA